jgi:hypothetical protein
MVENARDSNYFVLYQSFDLQSQVDGSGNTITVRRDATNNGAVNANDRRDAGQSGNFLIFVYYEDSFFDSRYFDGDSTNDTHILSSRINRIVGYWIAPNRNIPGESAVYKFDTDRARTPSASSWTTAWGATLPVTLGGTTTLESLLPPDTAAWAQNSAFEILINDASGLAPDGYNFSNFQNRSALVRTKILHGNQAKRVTNTYNFTITPRG